MPAALARSISDLVGAVIELVAGELAAGGFGPRCEEAALRVLAARDGLWPPQD